MNTINSCYWIIKLHPNRSSSNVNMPDIPENIRQVLIQLLPAYILNDVKCYVLYDNHPRDEKNIDITVYTKTGEVREYFQRDLVSVINLENHGVHSEIRIMRNSRCDLFYLVSGGGELTILSRKNGLQIHQRLYEVSYYKIYDSACSGEAVLHVVHQNSEIPVIPDDNFENFQPVDFATSTNPVMQSSIIEHLMRKLMEAKYSVKCNEKSLQDFVNIRQLVAFSMYKSMHPNLDEVMFKDGLKGIGNALKVTVQKPWIRTCNKKVVIVHNICNYNEQPLEEVQVLLHGTPKQSIEYTTKIFEATNIQPFWIETQSQILMPNVESAVVVVLDLEDSKNNIISNMKFDGAIIYKKENEGILPIESIKLSSLHTMGEQFDVMCNDQIDKNVMLAILATTEKTELILRHIKRPEERFITMNTFCEYLNMERVPCSDKIVVHRKSPYHVLNGVMIILETVKEQIPGQLAVAVHSRTPSQILALIHHIQDAVPFRIIITTPTYKITSKTDSFSSFNESTASDYGRNVNYMNYATSMLNRTHLVLEYLDNSMVFMNQSKSPVIRDKIGTEIDLFAQGDVGYMEFKKKMRDEADKGVELLEGSVLAPESDEMCPD